MTNRNDNLLVSVFDIMNSTSSENQVLLDCRSSLGDPAWGYEQYRVAHIPGAFYASLDRDLSGPPGTGGRHPLPDRTIFEKKLGLWGIDSQTKVIAYDDGSCAYACRLWWLCRWMGHSNVAVLDGGISQWMKAGGVPTKQIPQKEKAHFQAKPPLTRTVDATEILTQGYALVDARTEERFNGQSEPIDRIAGHIPGAICRPFMTNIGTDGLFNRNSRHFDDIPPNVDIVCYCGSGVTATQNLFALLLAGRSEPALYPGSWSEWIEDEHRPIATE